MVKVDFEDKEYKITESDLEYKGIVDKEVARKFFYFSELAARADKLLENQKTNKQRYEATAKNKLVGKFSDKAKTEKLIVQDPQQFVKFAINEIELKYAKRVFSDVARAYEMKNSLQIALINQEKRNEKISNS